MEDEVQLWGVERGSGVKNETNLKRNLCGTRDTDSKWKCKSKSCAHVVGRANTHVTGANSAILKRKKLSPITEGISRTTEEVLGQHLWARGYFCAAVGAVNEDLIKKYIENQTEEEGSFKVWDLEGKTEGTERPKSTLGGFIRRVCGL